MIDGILLGLLPALSWQAVLTALTFVLIGINVVVLTWWVGGAWLPWSGLWITSRVSGARASDRSAGLDQGRGQLAAAEQAGRMQGSARSLRQYRPNYGDG